MCVLIFQAEFWYLKAVEYGYGPSTNNMALLYMNQNPRKAFEFWTLGAYLGHVKAIENGAKFLHQLKMITEAAEWYQYAVFKGSIEAAICPRNEFKDLFRLRKPFDPSHFYKILEKNLRQNVCYVSELFGKMNYHMKEIQNHPRLFSYDKNSELMKRRQNAVLRHRENFLSLKLREERFVIKQTSPAYFVPNLSRVNLGGQAEMYLKGKKF